MSLPQVQIAGYGILLWAVKVSDTSLGEYSVLSIAVAMYLNISIASPDLWASFGLIMSNRGYRAFGIALLVSFVMLFASSTRVLFSTSGNNVDLIIGAVAVLFIADMVRASFAHVSNDALLLTSAVSRSMSSRTARSEISRILAQPC